MVYIHVYATGYMYVSQTVERSGGLITHSLNQGRIGPLYPTQMSSLKKDSCSPFQRASSLSC